MRKSTVAGRVRRMGDPAGMGRSAAAACAAATAAAGRSRAGRRHPGHRHGGQQLDSVLVASGAGGRLAGGANRSGHLEDRAGTTAGAGPAAELVSGHGPMVVEPLAAGRGATNSFCYAVRRVAGSNSRHSSTGSVFFPVGKDGSGCSPPLANIVPGIFVVRSNCVGLLFLLLSYMLANWLLSHVLADWEIVFKARSPEWRGRSAGRPKAAPVASGPDR